MEMAPSIAAPGHATEASTIAVLNQILALPRAQRLALGKAWAALDAGFNLESAPGVKAANVEQGAKTVNELAEPQDISEWIGDLQLLTPRQRIEALQLAIDHDEDLLVLKRLRQELSNTKSANLLLTAELAITDYAYANPLHVLVLGAVAVIAIFRGASWIKSWLA